MSVLPLLSAPLTALRAACLLLLLPLLLAPPLAAQEGEAADEAPPSEEEIARQELLQDAALRLWTGDLDGMIERRMIRVLVVPSRIFYFTDNFRQRGITYEALRIFEEKFNKERKLKKTDYVHVVFVPVSRDRLLPALVEGLGDIAAAGLTVTPDRQALVDFSLPFTDTMTEVLVTAPGFPAIATVEELSGQEVAVRRSSSYYESLVALNQRLEAAGKPEVAITLVDELLEDDAIAEMVNAWLYPATVMDLPTAELVAQVFDQITLHKEIALREGGQIAWAIRKDSPLLKEAADAFVKANEVGTSDINTLIRRYLQSDKFIRNVASEGEQAKFAAVVELFKQYSGQYGFDWLLMIAQGYQESTLDQSVRSPVGAIGIMQVLPETAAGNPINIDDISNEEANIHAGVKYMRFMVDEYFADPAIADVDRYLFAFAGYNAGPNRIDRLRKKAADKGLDPNRWFNNVELLVSKEVGRQPVDYVANIFKYYIAFKRLEELKAAQDAAEQKLAQ